jgi:nitrate reductase molybdenum cofactor assembly chaperone NarJ/NarW
VINFTKLNQLKDVFIALSRLLDYPDQETFAPEFRRALTTNPALTPDQQAIFGELFDQLNQGTLLEQESHFASLFEMNRRYTLYMSYYKMTDSRERGTIIAKLKMMYEMFGVAESTSELADYLPMLLEFFAYGDFMDDQRQGDLQLALGVIEDGTYSLLQNALPDADDPYMQLIKAVRELIRSCIETEANTHA